MGVSVEGRSALLASPKGVLSRRREESSTSFVTYVQHCNPAMCLVDWHAILTSSQRTSQVQRKQAEPKWEALQTHACMRVYFTPSHAGALSDAPDDASTSSSSTLDAEEM